MENWISTNSEKPNFYDDIEISHDGVTVHCRCTYLESRRCMMAGIAGGHGYFGEGFATSGYSGEDSGLILDIPKYWRHFTP